MTDPEDLSPLQFHASDLDRLADYAAGVLDRVEAAEVSRLIATQLSWADAYLGLVAADAMTKAQLRADARARLEPMPSEVIARLDAAFQRIDVERLTPMPSAAPAVVVPLEPARRRRRLTGLVAAAAAITAIAGGVTVATTMIGTTSQSTSGGAGGALAESDRNSGHPAVPAPAQGGPVFVATGTDYGPTTLAKVGRATSAPNAGVAEPSLGAPKAINDAAERFSDFASGGSLSACLAALTQAHPGTVTVVDYARYLGTPALVVFIRTGTGGLAVAVGPACGMAGTDERASAPVP
ncbi:MAG: hypothetical protein ACM30G_14495 [Micromonosporaceae bacterium]